MRSRSPEAVRRWLDTEPPLEELRSAYPAVYDGVQREISAIVGRGDLEELKAYVLRLSAPAGSEGSRRERRAAAAGRSPAEDLVRRHVAAAALKQVCATAATRRIAAGLGAAGVLAGDPEREERLAMTAQALKAALNGLADWWLDHPDVPRERVVAHATELLGDGLLALLPEPRPT